MKQLTPKQQKRRELLSDSNKPLAFPDNTLPLAIIALMFGRGFSWEPISDKVASNKK